MVRVILAIWNWLKLMLTVWMRLDLLAAKRAVDLMAEAPLNMF
jgi:hypothetical protein